MEDKQLLTNTEDYGVSQKPPTEEQIKALLKLKELFDNAKPPSVGVGQQLISE